MTEKGGREEWEAAWFCSAGPGGPSLSFNIGVVYTGRVCGGKGGGQTGTDGDSGGYLDSRAWSLNRSQ